MSIIGTIVALLLIASFIYDGYLEYKERSDDSKIIKAVHGFGAFCEQIVAFGWIALGMFGAVAAFFLMIFEIGG